MAEGLVCSAPQSLAGTLVTLLFCNLGVGIDTQEWLRTWRSTKEGVFFVTKDVFKRVDSRYDLHLSVFLQEY